MLAEFGHFTLILSFLTALALGVLPLIGTGLRGNQILSQPAVRLAQPAALLLFCLLVISTAALAISFYNHDFTIQYVANHSNVRLPAMYRISAVWGSHEGSMLFWCLVLAGWTAAVAVFSKKLPSVLRARVLAILGLVSLGFIAFTLFTSNPFDRGFLLEASFTGHDLNPILQHPGQALHPPLLYFGYVGFAVPFAFAMAALLGGKLDALWIRWARPWALLPWLFLTIGITLGSWWAYHELGWGGWWFWDPVENASFMPWLTGTALIHSLAATEKRGVFKSWSVLLAIICFAFSILGTLLVRSGLIESVHAFASDPSRGLYLLIFFLIVVVGSLAVFALRVQSVADQGAYAGWSRELMLLANNVILTFLAVGVVLGGTLAPMIAEAFGYNKSFGPELFERSFIVLGIPLMMIMGLGSLTRWKRDSLQNLFRKLWLAIPALVAGFIIPWLLFGELAVLTVIGAALAAWVVLTALVDPAKRLSKSRKVPLHVLGMTLAHVGMGIFVLGATAVNGYSMEERGFACIDDTITMGVYDFTIREKQELTDSPVSDLQLDADQQQTLDNWLRSSGVAEQASDLARNYYSATAAVEIHRNIGERELIGTVYPEQRVYIASGQPTKESAVYATPLQDLYTAIEIDGDGHWRLNVHLRPLIRWVWLGALLMALGGLFAALDRRYRLPHRDLAKAQHDLQQQSPQAPTGGAV